MDVLHDFDRFADEAGADDGWGVPAAGVGRRDQLWSKDNRRKPD